MFTTKTTISSNAAAAATVTTTTTFSLSFQEINPYQAGYPGQRSSKNNK